MMQMKGCAKYRLSVISAEFLQFSIKIKKTATYLLNPTEGGSKAPTVALMKDPVTIRLLKIFLPDVFFFFKRSEHSGFHYTGATETLCTLYTCIHQSEK